MNRKRRRMIYIALGIVATLLIAAAIILNMPAFGRNPRGARLERITKSPQYKDEKFNNELPTDMLTGDEGRLALLWNFLFDSPKNIDPDKPIPSVKTDLDKLPKDSDLIVWFGHSGYLLQLGGKRFLIDPSLVSASPFSFIKRPYKGADIYKPDDMPAIDYLVITHDHYDHLDYNTVTAIRNRVDKVITPLGVGEHFEYWKYPAEKINEMDWYESLRLDDGYTVHCLPARHFSGRSLNGNNTLWGSFLIETPQGKKIYVGGDSGYAPHYRKIGQMFPGIDLAILENGQYNQSWNQIHTMPQQLGKEAMDLGAKRIVTVHHSKFTLAKHAWDEPLENEKAAAQEYHLDLMILTIGKPESI